MSCKHDWSNPHELGADIRCRKCGFYRCDICNGAVKNPIYGMCRPCYGGLYGKDSEDME